MHTPPLMRSIACYEIMSEFFAPHILHFLLMRVIISMQSTFLHQKYSINNTMVF